MLNEISPKKIKILSPTRTKGCAFRGTTSIRWTLSSALYPLTNIKDCYNGHPRAGLLSRKRFLRHSIQATFSRWFLRGLTATGHTFSVWQRKAASGFSRLLLPDGEYHYFGDYIRWNEDRQSYYVKLSCVLILSMLC